MEFDKYKESLKDFSTKGEIEWEMFLDFFNTKNPAPEVVWDTPIPVVKLGIKFYLVLLSAIGAGLLSAFRVGERFYAVASAANAEPLFAYGETVSAVFAVNMTIFALAILVAYRTKKMSTNSQMIGLIVAITISAFAGLGQAFKGLNLLEIVQFFDLGLAFVMGVGVTALEYLTGDMLGVEIVANQDIAIVANEKYNTDKQAAYAAYLKEHKQWLGLAKSSFGLWKANYEKWASENTKQEQTPVATHTNQQIDRVENLTNRVFELLTEEYKTGRVLSVTELGRALAPQGMDEDQVKDFVMRKKGNLSQVRHKWLKANNIQI